MDLRTWLATVIGTAAALSPLVALAVWFVKATPLSNRYYPHVSVAAGLILATGISWASGLIEMKEAWLIGFIAAGIASGGFALGKSGDASSSTTSTSRSTSGSGLAPTVTVERSVTETKPISDTGE